MKITIHRGTDQIGGCVTEYESNGWRLFVDFGEQLPGCKHTGALEIEGLSKGDISKSALLITHYHGDHIGCIKELPKELPIYMGKLRLSPELTTRLLSMGENVEVIEPTVLRNEVKKRLAEALGRYDEGEEK